MYEGLVVAIDYSQDSPLPRSSGRVKVDGGGKDNGKERYWTQ